MPASRERSCTRKTKYNHKQAKEQVKVRGDGGSCYRCKFCGSWHVTHLPENYINPWVWRQIRRRR